MGNVMNFKCPCCAAKLVYNGEVQEMTCEYCGSQFSMEQIKAAEESLKDSTGGNNMVWNTADQQIISDENGKVQGYRCQSCGAEMVADENTAATECPYCGNPSIIPQSFEGLYRPDLMIPFAVGKKQASEKLKEFTRGKKLLPDSFTAGNRIEKITGIYVPFWLYSCHASGSVSFDGVKAKCWEDANYTYVRKNHYHITRSGEMDFNRIPVDAASQMDDATMDSLEPFDFDKATEYDPAYFSGYLADRYDVKESDAQPRANERVQNSFRSKMRDAVNGYTEVTQKSESINLTNAKAEYAMLPVWMMTTKYEGKSYTFGINGQSGKLVGSLPIDMGKYYKYMGIAWLIAFIICSAFSLLFTSNGITLTGELIAAVIALLVGWLYANGLKGAMNTIAPKRTAAGYLKDSSLKLAANVDRFLYYKTEKTEKPQNVKK
ncbi:hypothetical protein [Oribacterium sp. NK2B42]|uniref:hypothetical protein n=1 Tax=Oribacterium sp. NK2B42 TaxID=689781 RepID=UPI0004115FD3|nr:hypothetical protein [Oribacterium sp. NK2B42]